MCKPKNSSTYKPLGYAKMIKTLMHQDQSGFMPDRSTHLNLTCLFDCLAYSREVREPTAVISLDATKAYDNLDWSNMFKVMN